MISDEIKISTMARLRAVREILEHQIIPDYQDAIDITKEPDTLTSYGLASQMMTSAASNLDAALFLLTNGLD